MPLHEVANIRAAVDVPLDIYIEAPDNLGGMMRYHQLPELVEVAAPVYIKFGLRNAPDVYPAGSHISATAATLCRERTRRARVALDVLKRAQTPSSGGVPGAAGLALPRPQTSRPRCPRDTARVASSQQASHVPLGGDVQSPDL